MLNCVTDDVKQQVYLLTTLHCLIKQTFKTKVDVQQPQVKLHSQMWDFQRFIYLSQTKNLDII